LGRPPPRPRPASDPEGPAREAASRISAGSAVRHHRGRPPAQRDRLAQVHPATPGCGATRRPTVRKRATAASRLSWTSAPAWWMQLPDGCRRTFTARKCRPRRQVTPG